MDIIQETFNFAKKIQKTEQFLNLKKAKECNDNDKQLQDLINEFNMIKLKIEYDLKKMKTNENEKNSEKLNEIYDKIMKNEHMTIFNKASDEMNVLMNKINKILVTAVNGKSMENFNEFNLNDDNGCTGNCHDCSECF